jgi:tetratricopeptide (TPR) repeat protein
VSWFRQNLTLSEQRLACYDPFMPMAYGCRVLILNVAVAFVVWAALSRAAFATGAEPGKDPKIDPAPCLAAAVTNDDDKVISACGPLIDHEKTAKADRLKALLARGAAYDRKDMLDSAIADYNAALMLDSTQADAFNTRGELWRRRGDRPKALADFGAAIKLNPDHPSAKGNYRSLAQELERVGALMAVYGKPSFNCATAKKAVEKAICASAELANLDREINAANAKVVESATQDSPRAGRALQREQDQYLIRRNAAFGRPGYDLRKAMKERLDHLLAIELN